MPRKTIIQHAINTCINYCSLRDQKTYSQTTRSRVSKYCKLVIVLPVVDSTLRNEQRWCSVMFEPCSLHMCIETSNYKCATHPSRNSFNIHWKSITEGFLEAIGICNRCLLSHGIQHALALHHRFRKLPTSTEDLFSIGYRRGNIRQEAPRRHKAAPKHFHDRCWLIQCLQIIDAKNTNIGSKCIRLT